MTNENIVIVVTNIKWVGTGKSVEGLNECFRNLIVSKKVESVIDKQEIRMTLEIKEMGRWKRIIKVNQKWTKGFIEFGTQCNKVG